MNFSNSIMTCYKKYGKISGRASRSEFWWFYLFSMTFLTLFSIQIDFFFINQEKIILATIFSFLMIFLFIPPLISATIRRLHDMNKNGLWLLIVLIPYLGCLVLFIMCAKVGNMGANRFGIIMDK
jgi:uncharacterized membrane protein YhaH (DUF805 family)